MSFFSGIFNSATSFLSNLILSDSQIEAVLYVTISAALVEDDKVEASEKANILQTLFNVFPSADASRLTDSFDAVLRDAKNTEKEIRSVMANKKLKQAALDDEAIKALMTGISKILKTDGNLSGEESQFLKDVF